MSHLFKASGGTDFQHNNEWPETISEGVTIIANGSHVFCSARDLVEFVAHMVRVRKMTLLEESSLEELLGVPANAFILRGHGYCVKHGLVHTFNDSCER